MVEKQTGQWHYGLRLTDEERRAVQAEADRQDRSMAWIIKQAIKEYVTRQQVEARR